MFSMKVPNMSRIFPAVLLLAGCSQSPTPIHAPNADPTDRRITELAKRVSFLELTRNWQVTLAPTDKEFGFLDTEVGPLAISVQSVKASANGTEAVLNFGNTTNASISGIKYTVEWGAKESDGSEIASTAHTAERTIDTPLYSGTWNTVSLTLADIPPGKLGYIRISKPQITNIRLNPPLK